MRIFLEEIIPERVNECLIPSVLLALLFPLNSRGLCEGYSLPKLQEGHFGKGCMKCSR